MIIAFMKLCGFRQVRQIKRVLMEQLEFLKGENMKQYKVQKGNSVPATNGTAMSPTAHR